MSNVKFSRHDPALYDRSLFDWRQPRKTVYHPGNNRNRVLCDGCGKTLSTFPESVSPEPAYCEDEQGRITKYWCQTCALKLEQKLEEQHRLQRDRAALARSA